METESDWSEEAIERRLDAALQRHLPALAADWSGTEIEATTAAYRAAFELIFDTCGEEANFAEAVRKAVAETAAGDAVRIVRDHRIFREIATINAEVEATARKLFLKEEPLTSETKERAAGMNHRLGELMRTIESECPYLIDSSEDLARPPLAVCTARSARQMISESTLDCKFIVSDGRCTRMSLRLGRLRRDGV